MRIDILLTLLAAFIYESSSLDCYGCKDEKNNRGKCSNNIVKCGQFQDACIIEISYRSPVKLTSRGYRRHYITKDCGILQSCKRRKSLMSTTCRRSYDWSWSCTSCCTGDLCNYFIQLSGYDYNDSKRMSLDFILIISSCLFILFI